MSLKRIINNWCQNRLDDFQESKKVIEIAKQLETNNNHFKIDIFVDTIFLGYLTNNNLNYLQIADLILDYLDYKEVILTPDSKFIIQSEQQLVSRFNKNAKVYRRVIDIYHLDNYLTTVKTLNDAVALTGYEKNTIISLIYKKKATQNGYYFMYR